MHDNGLCMSFHAATAARHRSKSSWSRESQQSRNIHSIHSTHVHSLKILINRGSKILKRQKWNKCSASPAYRHRPLSHLPRFHPSLRCLMLVFCAAMFTIPVNAIGTGFGFGNCGGGLGGGLGGAGLGALGGLTTPNTGATTGFGGFGK